MFTAVCERNKAVKVCGTGGNNDVGPKRRCVSGVGPFLLFTFCQNCRLRGHQRRTTAAP